MSEIFGATQEEWDAFATLNLSDLLPTITNPDVKMSARSQIKAASSKTPCFINANGEGEGFLKWPEKITTGIPLSWHNPNVGICMIARNIHAIDIDVHDKERAQVIEDFVWLELGEQLPCRSRPNSGKRLLMYRLAEKDVHLTKTRVRVTDNGEIVEFLHQGQQFLVAGKHPSGVRYEWLDGIPKSLDEIPLVTLSQLQELHRNLHTEFGDVNFPEDWNFDGKDIIKRNRNSSQVALDDPELAFLYANDWVKSDARDGGIYVRCPWERHHTSEGSESETKYFPLGLGGNTKHSGFKCMHTSFCGDKTHKEFLVAIGYEDQVFEPVVTSDTEFTRPHFTYKGKTGVIEATLANAVSMVSWKEGFGFDVRYDSFKDEIVWRQGNDKWQILTNDTYLTMRLQMAKVGIDNFISEKVANDAIRFVAVDKKVDTAQEWLKTLRWDGVCRVEEFHQNALKLEDNPYHRSVGLYMWTALAGRINDPGCKADMVPVLVGKQGKRKSTLVELLAPTQDEFVTVSLADRDADLSRMLKGKMVAEWGEMRGLESRDADGIKDWVSRRKDDWIPKYKEVSVTLPRRYLLIGTTNNRRFLNDPTGARRWLPLFVDNMIDTLYVQMNRDQLWAEAAELHAKYGVVWQEVESLAVDAQHAATVRDVWVDPITDWLAEQKWAEGWTTSQLLQGACGVPTPFASRKHQERLRRVMAYIAWEENEAGRWHSLLA